MKKYIAVVEDIDSEAELLISCLDRYFKENKQEYEIKRFYNGKEFLDNYDFKLNIVFIDINMPKMNGLETTKLVREKDSDISIVFVTSLAQYALFGYEVSALDYILKPIEYATFSVKLNRILSKLKSKEKPTYILNSPGNLVSLKLDEIYYVEVRGHYCYFITKRGEFVKHCSLGSIINEDFFKGSFALCNKCYFVNLGLVKSVKGYDLTVGEHLLLISRPRKNAFLKELSEYNLKG